MPLAIVLSVLMFLYVIEETRFFKPALYLLGVAALIWVLFIL